MSIHTGDYPPYDALLSAISDLSSQVKMIKDRFTNAVDLKAREQPGRGPSSF